MVPVLLRWLWPPELFGDIADGEITPCHYSQSLEPLFCSGNATGDHFIVSHVSTGCCDAAYRGVVESLGAAIRNVMC